MKTLWYLIGNYLHSTAPTFSCFPYQRIMCCHVGNAFQCLVFLWIFRQIYCRLQWDNVNFIAYTHIPSAGPHAVLDALEVYNRDSWNNSCYMHLVKLPGNRCNLPGVYTSLPSQTAESPNGEVDTIESYERRIENLLDISRTNSLPVALPLNFYLWDRFF